MNTYTTEKPEITLQGISVRTTNAEEAGLGGRLPGLWEAYFKSSLASRSGIINPHLIYALYTDYESDASGEYKTLIGHEAGAEALQADTGYDHAVIPASRYMVFTTKRGPIHEVVPEAWREIWAHFSELPEARAYTGDFELYDSRNFDPANAEVQIYIAMK